MNPKKILEPTQFPVLNLNWQDHPVAQLVNSIHSSEAQSAGSNHSPEAWFASLFHKTIVILYLAPWGDGTITYHPTIDHTLSIIYISRVPNQHSVLVSARRISENAPLIYKQTLGSLWSLRGVLWGIVWWILQQPENSVYSKRFLVDSSTLFSSTL